MCDSSYKHWISWKAESPEIFLKDAFIWPCVFFFSVVLTAKTFQQKEKWAKGKGIQSEIQRKPAQVWKSSLPVESYREHAIPPATDKACEEPPSTRDHGPRVYRERLMLAPSAQQTPKFQTLGRRVAFQDKLYSVYKQLRGSDPLLHLGESFTSV